jgi:hypothetical protein
MKNTWRTALRIVLTIAVLCFCGCASQSDLDYANKAKEHEFTYFFPRPSFYRLFATIEEAYDYVNTAQVKFSTATKKPRVKGLSSRLSGPPVSGEQPVTVVCFIHAQDARNSFDLSDPATVEKQIRNSISAVVIFMVFYGDRGVAIPSYFLEDGWAYDEENAQPKRFSFNDNTYNAEYPAGWGIDKAFSYLRKEIN